MGDLVVPLSDRRALDPNTTGAKAANLAIAANAGFATVAGFVITTDGVAAGLSDPLLIGELRDAHDALFAEGTAAVVRSSSTIEDAGSSSMAGRFTSVLDVVGWDRLLTAIATVVQSADTVRDESGAAQPIAVLVQRQLTPALGGVLFGIDPVTGDAGHVVVEAVPGRPDVLVGGTAVADHYVLSRRGRILGSTIASSAPRLPRALRRSLVRLASRAADVFGSPQDIEWCVDEHGALWLLQSRPVTASGTSDDGDSVVLGPGPIAETFPLPLRPLEVDLWIAPIRDGIRRALLVSGAVRVRTLDRSPIVTTIGGWAAVDLELFGLTSGHSTLRRRLHPLAVLRRLATAWRVGRLRVALPALATSVVETVDRDLADVPRLDELTLDDLVDVLARACRELASVHALEVLAGMLLRDQRGGSAAAIGLQALHDGRFAGWDDDEIIARAPIVLSLVPPTLLDEMRLPKEVSRLSCPVPCVESLPGRDALRLRARWLQELQARLVRELAVRLVEHGCLASERLVCELGLSELITIATGGPPPSDLAERAAVVAGPALPPMFRVERSGRVKPATGSTRLHRHVPPAGLAAGSGQAIGIVVHEVPEGEPHGPLVLVTRHLEPQLAAVLDRVVAIVSETGSALSHLAILAREAGLPTVAAVPDALRRFPPGTTLRVDGSRGEVEVMAPDAVPGRAGAGAEVVG